MKKALLSVIAALAVALAGCGLPTGDQPAGTQATAVPSSTQATPAPDTNYVGVPPINAPKNPAADLGFVAIKQVGVDRDSTKYEYTGGTSRWFAMRQTGENTAKTFEIGCSTDKWVWVIDAVTATFGGRGMFDHDPMIVFIDRCPFEITQAYVFTGQIGAVARADIPYAVRDRKEGFEKASHRPARFFNWDGSKLVPMQT